jgi:hypothetical protein
MNDMHLNAIEKDFLFMFYCTFYEDLQVLLFDVMEQQQATSYFGQMMVRNGVGSSSVRFLKRHFLFQRPGVGE